MTAALTIDASVWVNADSPSEPNHASSRALLDHVVAVRMPVVVPTLLLAEVAGVVSRTRGDAVLAKNFVAKLTRLPFVRWVPLDEALAERAAELAADRALRGADAVYAAVAIVHGCDLVSLDREHLTRLPQTVTVLTPTDALARLVTPPQST